MVLTKGSRAALERYRVRGWGIEDPVLVEHRPSDRSLEARDRRQARMGGVSFVAHMTEPNAAFILHGYGGTSEDAAQDVLRQAGQIGR